jgi:CheY-like chemotaxis protein
VLLADDDPRVRGVVETMLGHMGHRVVAAEGGAQLLDLVDDGMPDPDLLLADVMMPQLSGPMLADLVRTRFPGIRVLFMSGVSADWLAAEGRLDPSAPLIVKPFDQVALARRIEEVLGGAGSPETILLVEDSDGARDALAYILSECGYRVLAAGSLAEARLLGRHDGRIDFLLTDLRLPDGNGEELARELGADHPAMRTLVMSGSLPRDAAAGRVHFVKPIDVDALLAELERPR